MVLLYGVESWRLPEAPIEMCYRRIPKISWMDHINNKEVLRRISKDREILYYMKPRKLEYLCHIMRNEHGYGLLQLIRQGKVYDRIYENGSP